MPVPSDYTLNPALFLLFFPEFKTVSIETLNAYLPVAHLRVPYRVWDRHPSTVESVTRVRYARALIMAHMLTIQGFGSEGSAGGAVTSETVGDLTRAYTPIGQGGTGDDELRATRYGIMFVELRNEIIVGVMPAGGRIREPFEPA